MIVERQQTMPALQETFGLVGFFDAVPPRI